MIWIATLLFVALALPAAGQTITGTILGAVSDPSGLAIAGADVTLTQAATSATRKAKTLASGDFIFNVLDPGVYTLTIEMAGFKTARRTSMNLTAAERLSVGTLALEIGNVSQQVEVSGAGAVVQTASAEHSGVLTSSQVENLSIKGRNIITMLQLLPGVVDTNAPDLPDRNFAINLNINGSRRNTAGVTVDGIGLQDSGNGWISTLQVSPDAVSEVKVLLNNYQAEYGRMRGAGVEMVIKSGTKDFHGSFNYFKRHEQFNANDFFNNRNGLPKAIYRFNSYS